MDSLRQPIPPHIRAIINDQSWLHPSSSSSSTPTPVNYIVGIDYGTTYSGFGLLALNDRSSSSIARQAGGPSIRTFDNWDLQPPGLFSPKLPTVSTYSRPSPSTSSFPFIPKLVSWGWTAACDISGRDLKLALAKLALHPSTPPHRKPIIPPGLDLTQIIADFLAELFKVIQSIAPSINVSDGDTIWCFTVPVNWNAAAMDVMRQAAYRAGLISTPSSPMLRFCEEPEAAALTCMEESGAPMEPGTRFLVIDAGGGTVDLFLCTVDPHSPTKLDEITVGAGDFLGASFIDGRFYAFLRNHLGDDAWESLTTSPLLSNTWRDVEARWENLKRAYRGPTTYVNESHANQHDVLTFSLSLYKVIPEKLKSRLRERQGTDDELWIRSEDMQSFFDPVVTQIRDMVRQQLNSMTSYNNNTKNNTIIDYIFFVGGFGSNRYLQSVIMNDEYIRKRLRHPQSVVLRHPESAVLKGAVRYGMDRGRIRTRIAKHTLALLVHVNARMSSIPTTDSNLVTIAGQKYLILVRRGDPVHYESLVTHSHLAIGDSSSTGVVKIFEIDGCLEGSDEDKSPPVPRLVGRIAVSAPLTPGIKRRVTLLVNFGELELKLRAVSEVDGREWRVTVQYDVTQDTRFINPASPLSSSSSSLSPSKVSVLSSSNNSGNTGLINSPILPITSTSSTSDSLMSTKQAPPFRYSQSAVINPVAMIPPESGHSQSPVIVSERSSSCCGSNTNSSHMTLSLPPSLTLPLPPRAPRAPPPQFYHAYGNVTHVNDTVSTVPIPVPVSITPPIHNVYPLPHYRYLSHDGQPSNFFIQGQPNPSLVQPSSLPPYYTSRSSSVSISTIPIPMPLPTSTPSITPYPHYRIQSPIQSPTHSHQAQ